MTLTLTLGQIHPCFGFNYFPTLYGACLVYGKYSEKVQNLPSGPLARLKCSRQDQSRKEKCSNPKQSRIWPALDTCSILNYWWDPFWSFLVSIIYFTVKFLLETCPKRCKSQQKPSRQERPPLGTESTEKPGAEMNSERRSHLFIMQTMQTFFFFAPQMFIYAIMGFFPN